MKFKYFQHKTTSPLNLIEKEIQPKLEVNPPNDRYEKQADELTDRTLRMSSNTSYNLQMSPKYEVNKAQMRSAKDEVFVTILI